MSDIVPLIDGIYLEHTPEQRNVLCVYFEKGWWSDIENSIDDLNELIIDEDRGWTKEGEAYWESYRSCLTFHLPVQYFINGGADE